VEFIKVQTEVILRKQINTPSSGFPNGDGVGRIGLALYPQNPNTVFAVVDNNFHQPETALKSTTDTTRYVLRDFKDLSKEQFAALDDKKIKCIC